MLLAQLLEGVQVRKLFSLLYGKMAVTADVEVRTVQYDSRRVQRGDLFVAVRGHAADGHAFMQQAIQNGAIAVVLEDDRQLSDAYFLHTNVMKIVVPDTRKALARLAANVYGHPSRALRVVAVTGTNGKTSTTYLIKSVFEAAGETVGLIGTIRYMIGTEELVATHTTPESLELQGLLAAMRGRGCSTVVMEVSSHALAQCRVEGTRFAAAVFTNLTQDHLDFHGSMERYFEAKRILFVGLGAEAVAITNRDDPYGKAMVEGIRARTVTYGADAQVQARDVTMTMSGLAMRIAWPGKEVAVRSSLTGRFNVANILAAAATGRELGVEPGAIARGIERLPSIRGRFEQIPSHAGWVAVVDYAHTPDALSNCLSTIRELMPERGGGRVITVFGCGGDRDRGKRPQMGRIATTASDIAIVTSDNPRHEDPRQIIEEILAGTGGPASVLVEPDRRTAIREALRTARPGDVVLIAGKGHEAYQIVGDTKSHFDDREEVETFLRESR